MGAALQLGPFVLPGAVLVFAAAAAVTGFTGKHMGGANGRDVETLIWQTLLFGLLVARLAFVWQFRSAYWAAPLEVLDIRDGGWSAEAGFAGGWLYAISQTARRPTLKRPLLWALAAGSAVWLAGTIAVAVVPGKGQPLPEIELATAQGTRVNLSNFVGKPTVVNIWATWCPPCVREMPGTATGADRPPFDPFRLSEPTRVGRSRQRVDGGTPTVTAQRAPGRQGQGRCGLQANGPSDHAVLQRQG
jgi:hypothetical protein